MLGVIYSEGSFMLIGANKPIVLIVVMPNVVMPSVIMLSVVAQYFKS
jgi:hypothetical protein